MRYDGSTEFARIGHSADVTRMTATGPDVIPNGGSASQVAWDGASRRKAMNGCRASVFWAVR